MWARAISSPDVGNVGQLRAILSARGANKVIRCTIHVIKSILHVSFTEDLSYGVAIFHIMSATFEKVLCRRSIYS